MTAFPHRHLLGIETLSAADLTTVMDLGERFLEIAERPIKKVPTLRGKTVINLFLEPSTRTRTSFEIAAKRLSADRHQHLGRGVVDGQGRDPAGHRAEPGRHVARPWWSSATPRPARRPCWPGASGPAWSTPATAPTSTRRRRCSTARPSGRTRASWPVWTSPSAATSRTAASPVRTSSRCPSWAPASASPGPARCCPRASSRWAPPFTTAWNRPWKAPTWS